MWNSFQLFVSLRSAHSTTTTATVTNNNIIIIIIIIIINNNNNIRICIPSSGRNFGSGRLMGYREWGWISHQLPLLFECHFNIFPSPLLHLKLNFEKIRGAYPEPLVVLQLYVRNSKADTGNGVESLTNLPSYLRVTLILLFLSPLLHFKLNFEEKNHGTYHGPIAMFQPWTVTCS